MSNTTLYTESLDCSGDCGAKIELTTHDRGGGFVKSVAEILGWKTVGTRDVYCVFCQKRAKRIVEGQ